jgi:hypothetical protein
MDASEIESILVDSRQMIDSLVKVQDAYDAVGWRVSEPASAKFRHMCLHAMQTTAKLARVAERNDHREDEGTPVSDDELRDLLAAEGLLLADVAVTLLQLVSLADVDLGAALHDLYRRNAMRFAPSSAFAQLEPWVYE